MSMPECATINVLKSFIVLLWYNKHFSRYPPIYIASPQLPHPLFPSPHMERGRGVSEGDALSPSK